MGGGGELPSQLHNWVDQETKGTAETHPEYKTQMASPGFSLSFEADGKDVKVGDLAIECLSHLRLFPGKVGGLILEVAGFLAGCLHLIRTLPPKENLLAKLHVLHERVGLKAKEFVLVFGS